MSLLRTIISVLVCVCMTSAARGGIVWRLIQGDVSVSIALVSGKYNVTITSTNGGGEVHFWSTTNGSDTIRYIRNTASGVSGVVIRVVPKPNNQYLVNTIEEVSEQSSSPLQVAYCEVTTDIGSVNAWSIGELVAGGNITGWIRANNSYGNSHISYMRAGGNITDPVTAIAGRSLEVTADGNVGASGSPISITAHDYVRRVMGASVHAVINATGAGVPYGAVARIVTTSGDFTGSLTCERIVPIDQGQHNIH